MQNDWKRFNREETNGVLEKLSTHKDAVVFSRDVTEVLCRPLPFYSKYRLYKLTNYATMPSFTMSYLGDGEDFISLDGTANPIYTANEKDPVSLGETNVIPYLDFFFGHVQGSEGDIFLIKDPAKMPFMSSLSPAQQQSVLDCFKPLQVSSDITPGHFRVSGTLYYDGVLLAATIQVTPEGKLAFQEQSMLLQGIHFPYSSATDAWLEAD